MKWLWKFLKGIFNYLQYINAHAYIKGVKKKDINVIKCIFHCFEIWSSKIIYKFSHYKCKINKMSRMWLALIWLFIFGKVLHIRTCWTLSNFNYVDKYRHTFLHHFICAISNHLTFSKYGTLEINSRWMQSPKHICLNLYIWTY